MDGDEETARDSRVRRTKMRKSEEQAPEAKPPVGHVVLRLHDRAILGPFRTNADAEGACSGQGPCLVIGGVLQNYAWGE